MTDIKWEYRMRTVNTFRSDIPDETRKDMLLRIETKLNGYGDEGWEAVTIWYDGGTNYVLFKRPVSK